VYGRDPEAMKDRLIVEEIGLIQKMLRTEAEV